MRTTITTTTYISKCYICGRTEKLSNYLVEKELDINIEYLIEKGRATTSQRVRHINKGRKEKHISVGTLPFIPRS